MTTSSAHRTTLVRLAQSGLLRARELKGERIPRTYLKRLCDSGELERIGRGVYRLSRRAVTEHAALAEVVVRTPQAVICLLTALQLYGLTTEAPHDVWVMIDNRARTPKVDYPRLKVVRASGKALSHGIEERMIERRKVRVTTPAKTVADCFRYRSHVGLDVAIAALREYVRRYRNGINELTRAAKVDQVYTVMRPYIEALV